MSYTPELANSTFLGEDTPSGESNTNYKKRLEIQLPYTQTALMAERLAKIALQHQRKTMQSTFLTTTKYLRLQPADFVYVTNERMGWSQQMFEVISTQLEFTEQEEVPVAAVRLTLKEIDAATYNFVTNDYVTPVTQGPVSEVPAGDYAITAPSNLAVAQILTVDGTTSKINIKATWTNNPTPYLFATEIAYKLNGESAALNRSITVGAGTTTAYLPNVTVGEVYNVKARHVSSRGVYSAYTSAVNITIAAASAAPAVPSSASITTGKALNMILTYTNPNNSDLKAVKIYRKTANSTPSGDSDGLVNTQYGSPNSISTWIDGKVNGLTAGTTYYYFVRSVNHSDVHSAFVAVGGGNFTNIATADIIADNITNALIATDAVNQDSIAANSVTASEINVSTLSAITANVGTLTAGTINGTNMSITNLSASNIDAGTLNANRINLNGTTLSVSSSGLQIGSFNANSHAIANSLGSVLFASASSTSFSNNTSAFTDFDTNYANGSLKSLLSSPITLTIPATLTAVSKSFLAQGFFAPIGGLNTLSATGGLYTKLIYLAISTSSDPSADGSWTESKIFITSGSSLLLVPITVNLGFNVTTSTSASVTRFVHCYGWLRGNRNDGGGSGFGIDAGLTGLFR